MAPKHINVALLACASAIALVSPAFNQQRQPMGVEMCKDYCRQFTGCKYCRFLLNTYVCKVSNVRHLPFAQNQQEILLNTCNKGLEPQLQQQCSGKNYRIIFTRSGTIQCVQYHITPPMTKLLVAPVKFMEKPFYQINLQDNSWKVYPKIKSLKVVAFAYVHHSRTLIIAVAKPYNIVSYPFDGGHQVMLKRQVKVRDIAVDVDQNLVLMIIWTPRRAVCKMTPEGKTYRCLIKLTTIAPSLCLDTNHKMIYISCMNKVLSHTYEGKNKKMLLKGKSILDMALDEDTQTLYYNNGHTLMQNHLSSNTSEIVATINVSPRNIVYHGGDVYISVYPQEVGVLRHSIYTQIWKNPEKTAATLFMIAVP